MVLFFLIFLPASCSRNNKINSSLSTPIPLQKSTLINNSWKAAQFLDKGANHSREFSIYSFQFNHDGTLLAVGTGTEFYGTWNITEGCNKNLVENRNHPGVEDYNKLIFNIAGNRQMEEISGVWQIITLSAAEMHLKEDNPSSGKEIHFNR